MNVAFVDGRVQKIGKSKPSKAATKLSRGINPRGQHRTDSGELTVNQLKVLRYSKRARFAVRALSFQATSGPLLERGHSPSAAKTGDAAQHD